MSGHLNEVHEELMRFVEQHLGLPPEQRDFLLWVQSFRLAADRKAE